MVFAVVITVALICVFSFAAALFQSKGQTRESVDDEILREKILACLPGENCGACNCDDCAALALKIAEGKARFDACPTGGAVCAQSIALILGEKEKIKPRMRAQVMCSGTSDKVRKKYIYDTDSGVSDCLAAIKLGGGDKGCKYACVGMGTCEKACPYKAISVKNGIARVDAAKCTGCGICVRICPKHTIKLIPYNAKCWVGCMSREKENKAKFNCGVGCIGCGECERVCPSDAIKIKNNLAEIDYSLCTACGRCFNACPEGIIWRSGDMSIGMGNQVFVRGRRKEYH